MASKVRSLASKPQSPQKLSSLRFEDSTIFFTAEILLKSARNLAGNLERPFLFSSFGDCLKIFFDLFFGERMKKNFSRLFFSSVEHLRLTVSFVLGLSLEYSCLGIERICPRKGCPWPRIFLWPWPWVVFCSVLEPYVLDSTSALQYVPPAPEVLAKKKSDSTLPFFHLILCLELSHNAIWNVVCHHLTITLYFSNKERKQIDRLEV